MTPAGGSGGCGDDCGGRPPRVSVMMNCRDAAATLPETLASLRAQTFRDFEVIFWDNASRDGSGDVAAIGGDQQLGARLLGKHRHASEQRREPPPAP